MVRAYRLKERKQSRPVYTGARHKIEFKRLLRELAEEARARRRAGGGDDTAESAELDALGGVGGKTKSRLEYALARLAFMSEEEVLGKTEGMEQARPRLPRAPP
jgi:hypothetical protein